ncbi:hypothetical protein BHM03_00052917 [Ensete ventricosum]|nr:hypothetical protein BHM03_00052917 [Ensete ventricosum]
MRRDRRWWAADGGAEAAGRRTSTGTGAGATPGTWPRLAERSSRTGRPPALPWLMMPEDMLRQISKGPSSILGILHITIHLVDLTVEGVESRQHLTPDCGIGASIDDRRVN